jgi:hypothetical protein
MDYFERTLIQKNVKNKESSKEWNWKEKNEFSNNDIRSNNLVLNRKSIPRIIPLFRFENTCTGCSKFLPLIMKGIGYIPSPTNLVPDAALTFDLHCNLFGLFLSVKYFLNTLLDMQHISAPERAETLCPLRKTGTYGLTVLMTSLKNLDS